MTDKETMQQRSELTLAAFGAEVLRDILDDDFFFESEESERWCELLEKYGYVERAVYDPEKHGDIDAAEPGEEVWIFTEKMRKADSEHFASEPSEPSLIRRGVERIVGALLNTPNVDADREFADPSDPAAEREE